MCSFGSSNHSLIHSYHSLLVIMSGQEESLGIALGPQVIIYCVGQVIGRDEASCHIPPLLIEKVEGGAGTFCR
ncbi:hypothetical protein E2C01_060741 [Portunus trituberculatus]|uniref:Uncharacterized protein n=1 Tax=Portunus trituberculatus TaxID=210409 RepID=A0A5B7H6C5_PORTR|nr:hypothetical protein [Portunus trituberculatus]